jgi:hypothetical protein
MAGFKKLGKDLRNLGRKGGSGSEKDVAPLNEDKKVSPSLSEGSNVLANTVIAKTQGFGRHDEMDAALARSRREVS